MGVLPAVMTETQVADVLCVSRATVNRLGRSGRLPRLEIGRSVRYRGVDLENFLNGGAR